MSQYMGVFLDEGREQLDLLEANILRMERGDHSQEMLQTLFRAAHTLKGSSRAMGFFAVGDLTHEMENILDDLRLDKLAVDTRIVNALLNCLDALIALIDSVATRGDDSQSGGIDVPFLVARLDALRTSKTVSDGSASGTEAAMAMSVVGHHLAVTDYEHTAIQEALATGLVLFRISITLNEDCIMKSVRVFMILGALEPLGSVLVSNPSEDELEKENFALHFNLLLATAKSISDVREALDTVSELKQISVELWDQGNELCAVDADGNVSADPLDVRESEPSVSTKSDVLTPIASVAPAHNQTIRVDVARLDNLLNLIGEMVIDRTQIARIGGDLHDRYPQDDMVSHLIEATQRVARITSELQDEIMKTRMLPIDGVFQRMPRMVRDLAQKTSKEIDFRMQGGETELDRSVLEVLGDPLIHLLRNSVDHGVETPEERIAVGKRRQGIVTMTARHEENHIVIEISDDGRGIDPVRIRKTAVAKGLITQTLADQMGDRDTLGLIFASGFSTAAVLSDISGRGVGMDIVKSNLERLGGRIHIDSKVGAGSRFTIHLPLTLAIVRALLVSAGGGTYVLPLNSVVEMLRLGRKHGDITRRTIGGQAVIILRGKTVPLASLADVMCSDTLATTDARIAEDAYVVIIGFGDKQVGLCVDGLAGEQEVVIKSLGLMLGDIPGLSGATILGDGRVALIVDVAKAVESIRDGSLLLSTENNSFALNH